MALQFINRELTRSGFVRALRISFDSNQDFRYKPHTSDPFQPADDSGVFIYDAWPWKRIGYPAIVVSLGPADPLLRTIGDEHRFDNTTEFESTVDGLSHSNIDSETYGGGIQTTVNIVVYARSRIQCSRVMDWLTIYIRHYFVDIFRGEGVNIISMSHGGETQQLVGNDPVYMDSLSLQVYSEFERTVSTLTGGTINAMSLTHVFATLEGATYGDDTN